MLPVFDVNATTDFIHPDDKAEPKTVFQIGVIDAKAQAWIDNQFTQLTWMRSEAAADAGKPMMQPHVQIDRSNKQIELVKLGLKGARNFDVPLKYTKQQYPFGERTVLDDATLNALKPYIPALATAIENNGTVTPDDEKK